MAFGATRHLLCGGGVCVYDGGAVGFR